MAALNDGVKRLLSAERGVRRGNVQMWIIAHTASPYRHSWCCTVVKTQEVV